MLLPPGWGVLFHRRMNHCDLSGESGAGDEVDILKAHRVSSNAFPGISFIGCSGPGKGSVSPPRLR